MRTWPPLLDFQHSCYVGFRYESPNGPLFRIGVAGLIDGDGPPAVYPVPGLSYGWRF